MRYVQGSEGWLEFLINEESGGFDSPEDELIELEDMISEGLLTDYEIECYLADKRATRHRR